MGASFLCSDTSWHIKCWHFLQTCVFDIFCMPRYLTTGGVRAASWTRDVQPMMGQRWAIVYDAGPTLTHHWFYVSCLLLARIARFPGNPANSRRWPNVGPASKTMDQHQNNIGSMSQKFLGIVANARRWPNIVFKITLGEQIWLSPLPFQMPG